MTLQRNPVAMNALQERRRLADHAHDSAVDAAGALSSAEMYVETLEMRIRRTERYNSDQASAAAALPDVVVAPDGAVEVLRSELATARERLEQAKRTHVQRCERFQQAQRDAGELQQRIYADHMAEPEEALS